MAAAAILDFSKFSISDKIFQFPYAQLLLQFKFQPNSSIQAEAINILVNPRWQRPPSWIFQNLAFLKKFSNFLCPGIYSSDVQPKAPIHADVINILVNPRWRPPPY